VTVKPYVAEEFKLASLDVPNITTVEPRRTFWDKVVILHGLRRWWERRGELRAAGQRVSRHYYDVHSLLASPRGEEFAADAAMAVDCVRHARMFFNISKPRSTLFRKRKSNKELLSGKISDVRDLCFP
jgi:nucleotidyltransferase AbiEii toxin of type IV toxin-antitoxin system